ncbi:MAG: queuosine precursor transporter [Fibrobacter sp.]|nr:queuosine precursor transporter [Fibrobacter sp.]
MKKTTDNLILLNIIFTVGLVISNVVTAKLMYTGFSLFGNPITLPGAGVCYAFTFLATDVIGEIWGKKEANKAVLVGLVGQVFATLLILLTQQLPAADASMQQTYERLLGQNWIFVVASLAGYLIAQKWDIWIFHSIRANYIAKHGDTKHRWIWNNASTMTSQILDTVVFIGIAFGIGFGWLFQAEMRPVLASMMVGQYVFKMLLAACDTPIFYLLTKNIKQNQDDEIELKEFS